MGLGRRVINVFHGDDLSIDVNRCSGILKFALEHSATNKIGFPRT
jgi:hypothetical protein